MNRIEIDKGEILVAKHFYPNKEGFIVSVKRNEYDSTFGMHIKIITVTGAVYDVEFPLRLLIPFKGMI